MNAAPSRKLIEAGLSGVIDYALLRGVADAESKSAPEVLDELACYVALEYSNGEMSFDDADAIMNSAFSVAVSDRFWAEHDRIIPKAMYEVYLAFDAGEYDHRGDDNDVDPEIKYTKQLVERFLAGQTNGV